MQHPDEGTIHAWLDGALPAAEASALEAHVASCAECEARMAEARGLIAASSRIIEHLDVVPGNVIPAVAPKPKSKSWLRSPWPAAIAATLVIGIGFVASRDKAAPAITQLEHPATPGVVNPKVTDSMPVSRPQRNTEPVAQQVPAPREQTGPVKKLDAQLPPPAATARRSAPVAASSPTPRALDAEKPVARQPQADNRAAEATITGRMLAKSAAGAGAASAARPPAAAPAAAIGALAAADELVDSASFARCYELVGQAMMTRVEAQANRFTLPERFALVEDPAPTPRLLGVRRLDADGNRGDLLIGAGWRIERGRAVVVDQDGRTVMTISKSDSGTVSASPAARVISCK